MYRTFEMTQEDWQAAYAKWQTEYGNACKKRDGMYARLRERTRKRLAVIDRGLGGEDFAHLAHNWYKCGGSDNGSPAWKEQKAKVLEILTSFENLQSAIGAEFERTTNTDVLPFPRI